MGVLRMEDIHGAKVSANVSKISSQAIVRSIQVRGAEALTRVPDIASTIQQGLAQGGGDHVIVTNNVKAPDDVSVVWKRRRVIAPILLAFHI